MKTFIIFILLSVSLFAQDKSINLRGKEIQLGMTADDIWEILKPDFNVVDDKNGNFYVSDDKDNPVGIIFFKDEKVVKVVKDWGTTFRSNVGQVFQTLWKIFKQYGDKLESVKVIPVQTFTPNGDKTSLQFYITDNRYIDINIQHSVTIFEIIEAPVAGN
jgi:hypothetical protein